MNNKIKKYSSPEEVDFSNKGETIIYLKQIFTKLNENEKMSLKEAMNIPEQVLESIYSFAHGHYQAGAYKKALLIFEMLAQAAPDTYKYIFGFAACLYQLQNYKGAISAFYAAFDLDPTLPQTSYYIADCLSKEKLYKEAHEFIQIAIEVCEKKEKYRLLKERCLLIKKGLEENFKITNLNR